MYPNKFKNIWGHVVVQAYNSKAKYAADAGVWVGARKHEESDFRIYGKDLMLQYLKQNKKTK